MYTHIYIFFILAIHNAWNIKKIFNNSYKIPHFLMVVIFHQFVIVIIIFICTINYPENNVFNIIYLYTNLVSYWKRLQISPLVTIARYIHIDSPFALFTVDITQSKKDHVSIHLQAKLSPNLSTLVASTAFTCGFPIPIPIPPPFESLGGRGVWHGRHLRPERLA